MENRSDPNSNVSLKGANRYVQRRETHFKWYFCSLVDSEHLKVEMKDLNYWAQPIKGTKVDLGSFVCTRIPPPGPDATSATWS